MNLKWCDIGHQKYEIKYLGWRRTRMSINSEKSFIILVQGERQLKQANN